MSMPDALPFDCPLCRSNEYTGVSFKRNDGSYHLSAYFQCMGCSILFAEPEKLTRLVRSTWKPEFRWREAVATRETAAYPGKWNAAAWMEAPKASGFIDVPVVTKAQLLSE
jgi:hypothetical protein